MAKAPVADHSLALPLVLDLDGTLHHSDLFWEGLTHLVRTKPLAALQVLWLAVRKGKAEAKLVMETLLLADKFMPLLPWDERVVKAAQEAAAQGRPVYVATGSSEVWATQLLVAHTIHWPVLGTTAQSGNFIGARKAAALVEKFGMKGFDYAGNSSADLKVWPAARSAWVANASASVLAGAKALGPVAHTFHRHMSPVQAFIKAMRPHQWLKNSLVFVPLLTAHLWGETSLWLAACAAFIGFSFCASGAYVLNDWLDIDADRAHPRKKNRPFASGLLPIHSGVAGGLGLLALGLGGGLLLSPALAAVLLVYAALTFAYSLKLKHIPVADVATLAALWGVRLWGGAVATGVVLSHWLLLFAFLMFYSLALLKRYIELRDLPNRNQTHARGYALEDTQLVAMQGISSGMLAVLVVALYLNSPEVRELYANPAWLLPMCPLLVWWLGRIWLLAHRGEVNEDPIVFAATDKPTLTLAALVLALMVLGSTLF